MSARGALALVGLASALALAGCRGGGGGGGGGAAPEPGPPPLPPAPHPFTDEELAVVFTLSPVPDPPPDPTNRWADDPAAARLGHWLFFDERLSGGGDVSCATCHEPARGFVDGEPLASGVAPLPRHTQALWNVAHNRWFFWDGRADTLWNQALFPLEDPREHAGSRLQYAHLVHGDPDLRAAYEEVFGPLPPLDAGARFPREGRPVPGAPDHPHQLAWDGMTLADRDAVDRVFANLGKALAAYQRQLRSASSPFDWYVGALRAEAPTLPKVFGPEAEQGLKLFVGAAGCVNCHHGPLLTDHEFHFTRVPPPNGGPRLDPGRSGAVADVADNPFSGMGRYSDDPLGPARVKVLTLRTGGHEAGQMKTPSLRNAAATAPYMHAGQIADLRSVVSFYSTMDGALPERHPDPLLEPRGLSDAEVDALVAFLAALTDLRVDPALLVPPPSPRLPAG